MIAWPSIGFAAEIIGLDQALQEAALQNPSLHAARARVEVAKARHRGAQLGYTPTLTASSGLSRSSSSTTGTNNYDLGLSARQNLSWLWRDKGSAEQARANLVAAETSLIDSTNRITLEVKTAFARLLFAQEQVALTETISKRRENQARLLELRYRAGREHKGSYLRSNASHHQALFDVERARRTLQIAQQELSNAMGRINFADLEATGALGNISNAKTVVDFEKMAHQVPAYLQSESDLLSARAAIDMARSDLYPDLNASAAISRGGTDLSTASNSWTAAVNLSLPLIPSGSRILNLQGVQAGVMEAQANLAQALNQTVFDLKDAFAAYQNAAERTEIQKEFLEAAKIRAQIARGQYESGLLTYENWDIIENDLITQEQSMLATLRDAVIAKAGWERIKGGEK